MTEINNFKWKRYWIDADNGHPNYDPVLPPYDIKINDNRYVFEEIQSIPCLILVGNSGIGKSTTIRQIVEEHRDQGKSCIFVDFKEYNNFIEFRDYFELQLIENVSEGKLNIFLDSLDEGSLSMNNLADNLIRLFSNISEEFNLRITCRITALPSSFEQKLTHIWDDPRKFQLQSLSHQNIIALANEYEIDVDHFIDEVMRANVEPLAEHPITLQMLLRIYGNDKKLPDTRTEVYRKGCFELVQERSTIRQIKSFDVNERLEVSKQIALLSVLCNRPNITLRWESYNHPELIYVNDCYHPDYPFLKNLSLIRWELRYLHLSMNFSIFFLTEATVNI